MLTLQYLNKTVTKRERDGERARAFYFYCNAFAFRLKKY